LIHSYVLIYDQILVDCYSFTESRNTKDIDRLINSYVLIYPE